MYLGWVLRPARAAVFAAVCVALSAAGHTLAEGSPIGPTALVVGFVGVFLTAMAAARRERRFSAILAGVYAGQAALHVTFTALTPRWCAGVTSSHSEMQMPAMAPLVPTITGHSETGHRELAMLAAHLGAGMVTAWWLRRGEAACWRLLRRVEATASTTLRTALASLRQVTAEPTRACGAGGLIVGTPDEPNPVTAVLLARCVPRRGPPALISTR